MKAGDKVRLTKVAGKESATLPTGHTVVGNLGLFEKGLALAVYGHGPSDQVVTTPVEMINWDGDEKCYCHTKNSTWKLELVK